MQNKTALTRWLFISVSIIIVGLIAWNTYRFFSELKENERAKMEIWAAAQKNLMSETSLTDSTSDIVLPILESNTATPMILFSHHDTVYDSRNLRNPELLKNKKSRDRIIAGFVSDYEPIEIYFENELFQTIYYGNSPLIQKIKYYPALLILIMILFFAAIYFFYKTSKSSEQNKLWAGMAKETAHQIGTPLSSLVGWTEILKTENVNPEYIVEMEKDVSRLETITERFSKIGSKPTLKPLDLVAETKTSFDYLKSRTSKLIEFELNIPEKEIPVLLNPQLFSWTIENLVKNGIDAMKGKGKITIGISQNGKNALVHINDTGKGIPKRDHMKVFSPGFTTKKRGWGLGLSLAKRIIQEYHNGKIHVLKSTKDVGTTMEIALQVEPNESH